MQTSPVLRQRLHFQHIRSMGFEEIWEQLKGHEMFTTEQVLSMLAKQAVDNAEIIISAACIVLGHSLAEDIVNECAKIDIELSPDEWHKELKLDTRKVSLVEVKDKGINQLFKEELERYSKGFGDKSLPTRANIFFRHVPFNQAAQIIKSDDAYYDASKLQEIDDLRHSIVHGEGMSKLDVSKTEARMAFLTEAPQTFLRSIGAKHEIKLKAEDVLGTKHILSTNESEGSAR